jgi:hypothetical protein
MTNYTIKTSKKDIGMYDHELFDEKGNLMKEDSILENGKTVKDTLYYHSIAMVPLMRHLNSESSKLEIEVKN